MKVKPWKLDGLNRMGQKDGVPNARAFESGACGVAGGGNEVAAMKAP